MGSMRPSETWQGVVFSKRCNACHHGAVDGTNIREGIVVLCAPLREPVLVLTWVERLSIKFFSSP